MGKSGRLELGLALLVLAGVAAIGGYAYVLQIREGDIVTGMRDVGAGGAVWGLYVVLDGCFLGAGASVMAIACIARFFRDGSMEGVARVAMPFAVACFLGAALSVMADQGRPLASLLDLSLYARARSPMFTTFTAVGGVCLFGGLVHCVLARRPDLAEYAKRPSSWQRLQGFFAAGYRGTPGQRHRRRQVGFWMSLFMLPAICAPALALAVLFVVRPARGVVLTLLEILAFLTLSFAAGLGLVVLAASLVERLAGAEAAVPSRAFARLGRWLTAALALSLLLVLAAEIGSVVSSEAAVASYGRAVLREYGIMFWTALATLWLATALLRRSLRRGRAGRGVLVLAAGLAVASCFLHHAWLLVAWQTHGLALPYAAGVYFPTWAECCVALGIIALCALLLLPAVRLIPFAPVAVEDLRPAPLPREWLRKAVTGLWLLLGLSAAALGLAAAARIEGVPFPDPQLRGAPLLFVGGLVIVVSAGALYEIWPERKS